MEGLLIHILGATVLALVCRAPGSDGVAVQRAFDVGDSLRVRATSSRVFFRVTFVVDVEAETELDAIAERCACVYVVLLAGQNFVGQVADLLSAAVEILEGFGVSARCLSRLSGG
jgi:hypothetical protein